MVVVEALYFAGCSTVLLAIVRKMLCTMVSRLKMAVAGIEIQTNF